MTKHAAVYTRVSTDEQTKGYSLSSQVDACLQYAYERGYQIVEIFKENYSGAILDRPELNKLRDATNCSQIDVIIWPAGFGVQNVATPVSG